MNNYCKYITRTQSIVLEKRRFKPLSDAAYYIIQYLINLISTSQCVYIKKIEQIFKLNLSKCNRKQFNVSRKYLRLCHQHTKYIYILLNQVKESILT